MEEMQDELKKMRANLQLVKCKAKHKWQEEYMNNCKPENLKDSPREARQTIFTLRWISNSP